MANPRKFSEKIALHTQKQAEETAAFEKIMREVSVATKPEDAITSYGLGNMQQQQSPATSETNAKPIEPPNNQMYRERDRSYGPIRRPADRKIDTSPYRGGNVAYLSPPSDGWRRTSSDSAIHQSLQTQNQEHNFHGSHNQFPNHSPVTQRRLPNVSSNIDIKQSYGSTNDSNAHLTGLIDERPRSSCGLSRLPGINIYPSQHDNTVQIPISNNTGSLPDLTSVHFPSPVHNPIDQEPDLSSSPYSSSPITASPTTLSPTTLQSRQNASFQYSPAHSPGDCTTNFSPTHSCHTTTNQQFLSVPGKYHQIMNKGINLENNTYEPSHDVTPTHQSYSNMGSQQQINFQSNSHSPPNNVLRGSHGNLSSLGSNNLSDYRSPKRRPSPGPSPGLGASSLQATSDSNISAPCSPASNIGNNGQYDQFQSTEYYINPTIQQHFEQFSLDWAALVQTLVESGCTWTAQVQVDSSTPEFINQTSNLNNYSQYDGHFSNLDSSMQQQQQQPQQQSQQSQQQQHTQQHQHGDAISMQSQKLSNNLSGSNSHLQNLQHSSNHQQQQQTSHISQQPNHTQTAGTPSGIPEIIFTDFSTASELSKDFLSDPLRPIDLELGTMDFAGYQMLTDPNSPMISDPTIEDSFRRDLN